jgi:hypothetical protein
MQANGKENLKLKGIGRENSWVRWGEEGDD